MNLALCLVIASTISGFIYLLDALLWARKRSAHQQPNKIIEYSRSFFPVFILVLLLRSWIVEPFRIPSGSLEPTLLVGDFLAVNKFIYGLRLPVLETKFLSVSDPKRGDIVVFRWPPDPSYDYIKRVVGVPGDHVQYRNKVLTINGQLAKQTFAEYTTDESSGLPVTRYHEDLLGIKHDIYVNSKIQPVDFDVTVPKGQYFMMGDNRDDSADSRYWGFVSDEYLRGKAWAVWMSWNSNNDSIRWNKLGQLIH